MSEEHFIKIKSVQEFSGGFGVEHIGTEDQMILDGSNEISISFNCICGQKFYKKEKAEEHLLENE